MKTVTRNPLWEEFEEVDRTRKFNKETARLLGPIREYLRESDTVSYDDFSRLTGSVWNIVNELRGDILKLVDSTEKSRLTQELIEKWNLKP